MLWIKYSLIENIIRLNEVRCIDDKKSFIIDSKREWIFEKVTIGKNKAYNEMWSIRN